MGKRQRAAEPVGGQRLVEAVRNGQRDVLRTHARLTCSTGRRLTAPARGLSTAPERPETKAPESLGNLVRRLFRSCVLVMMKDGNHHPGDQPGVVLGVDRC